MSTSTPPPRLQPPPPGAAATVVLPRWIVALLVGACAVFLAAVMFLLGRATAPAPPAVPTALAAGGSTPPAGAGPTEAPEYATAIGRALSGAPAASQNPYGGADAAAVAAYFGEMDAVAAEAKAGQDPQALAGSILDQAISGNMGGIDDLIATQRALEARLGRIVPPPSCREHHQRSVRLFGRAIALLERTREATTGQGSSDLASMASEGRAIEQEARVVDALANQLRRAAGLPPVS